MMPTPLLSLFSVGLTTGLIIESGDGLTWICPIINGQMIEHSVQKLPLAGVDVNQNLKNLLMREGINIASSAVDEIIQDIKEKNCYFVLDPNSRPGVGEMFNVPMPDGSTINIPNYVLYQAPEVLFNPSMLGYSTIDNITNAVIASLNTIDNNYWHELLSHIVISGGNLTYNGFKERFESELNGVLPQLGNIPRPKPTLSVVKNELIKLQATEMTKKKTDTCGHCGAYIDLSLGLEHCPSCGNRLTLPEIKLDLTSQSGTAEVKKKPGKCTYCNKEIADATSLFCPYCGRTIEKIEKPKISSPTKSPAQEFTEYMESSSKILKFFIPDNLQFSIFNGAAILGSLPSFLDLFITYEQFQSNKDLLYRDISEIL
jgi:actin-related protein